MTATTAPSIDPTTASRLRAEALGRAFGLGDADAVVRHHLGLHSTDYASPYLSLHARLRSFDAAAFCAALGPGGGADDPGGARLVRINSFRTTLHVVHRDDAALVLRATGDAVEKVGRRQPALKGLDDAAIERGVAALRGALEQGPRGTLELKAGCPALGGDVRPWLQVAMGRGQVVRTDAKGARSNRTRYALTEAWIPGAAAFDGDATAARREVLRRHVRAFGPVAEADLAWWLPAPLGEVRSALAACPELVRVQVDGEPRWVGRDALDAAHSKSSADDALDAPLVVLLPYEDPLPKAYVERGWYLDEALRPVLYPRTLPDGWPDDDAMAETAAAIAGGAVKPGVNVSGEIRPSVWVRGRVAGRWEERGKAGDIALRLHRTVDAEAAAAVDTAAQRLTSFLRDQLAPLG